MSNFESTKKLPNQIGNKEKARFFAKNDLSDRSKFFFCIPLNLASVKGISASIFITFALYIALTLTAFSLATKYSISALPALVLFFSFWVHIVTSGLILVSSVILCFLDRTTWVMQLWLYTVALSGYIQALSVSAIIGSIWSEFDKSEPVAAFKGIAGIHIVVFSCLIATYFFSWILAIYSWRAVFFYLSYEREILRLPLKPLELVEVRRLTAMDEPISPSRIRTRIWEPKPLKSDLEPTLVVPDTKALSDDLKPDSAPELKLSEETIKPDLKQHEPRVAEPSPEPIPPAKPQLGPLTTVGLKPEPQKPADKPRDREPKQKPSKSVRPRVQEPKQEPLESVRPKAQEPKPEARPKPAPTSPEELLAIEQAVDDWFKTKDPAENPSDTKNWVI